MYKWILCCEWLSNNNFYFQMDYQSNYRIILQKFSFIDSLTFWKIKFLIFNFILLLKITKYLQFFEIYFYFFYIFISNRKCPILSQNKQSTFNEKSTISLVDLVLYTIISISRLIVINCYHALFFNRILFTIKSTLFVRIARLHHCTNDKLIESIVRLSRSDSRFENNRSMAFIA